MRPISALAGAAVFACSVTSSPAQARDAAPVDGVMLMSGTCSQVLLGDHDLTKGCEPRLANVVYRDGRVEFTYALAHGATVTFSGIAPQVKASPDVAVQAIDRFVWQLDASIKPIASRVVGQCRYENPYKGRAHVDCAAEGKDGPFRARFITDGSEPTTRRF